LAKGLYVVITPFFNAYFPRFSTLVGPGDTAALRLCYHNAVQVMSVLCLPLAAVLFFFSTEISTAWLRDTRIATEVAPIASLLIVGNSLNGLMNIPFALQLATGRIDIGFYTNIFLVVILVPTIIAMTVFYGVIGAAATWAFANGLYAAVGVPITHKFVLVGEAREWLVSDVFPPMLVSVLVVALGRALAPHDQSIVVSLVVILLLWFIATACAAISANRVRGWGISIAKLRLMS